MLLKMAVRRFAFLNYGFLHECRTSRASWAIPQSRRHQRRFMVSALANSNQDVNSVLPTTPGKSLPHPSAEQGFAIDQLLNTQNNIIIDAMAGSGKTTTILHLARAAPETKFLVLVYNRRLMIETQERANALGLNNIVIYNYHTLGVRYYTPECSTDQGLKRVVEDEMSVVLGQKLPDFSILVMDEQQDLTPILKRFVDKVICDKGYALPNHLLPAVGTQLRVVVLGDQRQQIYSFNNADARFLTMAGRRELFGYINNQPWIQAHQTYSNRITEQNVDFINSQLLKIDMGTPLMRAARRLDKDGKSCSKPRYIICDPAEEAVREVERLIYKDGWKPADILILSPSTRGKSSAKIAANQMALKNIPVHRADSDVIVPSASVTHGKVLVCTYHQSKGIERPVCIVLGFDQQYHYFYDKQHELPAVVSNAQYVAATRAMEQLILLHDHSWGPLPFIDLHTINKTCEFIVRKPLTETQKTVATRPAAQTRYGVIALCRNLSETVITQCLEKLMVRQVVEPMFPAQAPPTEVLDKHGLLESTAAITGTAVPALYEWFKTRNLTILNRLLKENVPKEWIQSLPEAHISKFGQIHDKARSGIELSTGDILYIAHLSMANIDNDLVGLSSIQLHGYSWVTDAYIDHIVSMLNYIPKPANMDKSVKYEVRRTTKFDDIQAGGGSIDPTVRQGITLSGVMDITRTRKVENVVWEIKHIDTLHPEHLIQTALYMLLQPKLTRGYLVSARTGHIVEVSPATPSSLQEMLQILVGAKSGGPQAKLLHQYSDSEFLAEAAQDFSGLVGKCALPSWFSMQPQRSRFRKTKSHMPEGQREDGADLVT